MEPAKDCNCSEKHQEHMCVLHNKGLTEEIELLSNKTAVACFICGAKANSADYVCVSVPCADAVTA